MQERTLKNLILENDDYVFAGNLTITGEVLLINASLIVSGTLTLQEDAEIKGGDISCGSIDAYDIFITDGDIYVNGDAVWKDVTSDSNIEIGGNTDVCDIHCLNYLVNGDNNSCYITAMQDVYILGQNDSYALNARDVLIGDYCDFHDHSLIAKCFECAGEVNNLSSISVG